MDLRILRFEEIPSTNTEALSQARRGAGEGLCVIANSQTDGRGRGGKSWISEPDAGLYLSVVLRPAFESSYFPLITLAAAVAVSETLESEYGLNADIKWPNDVLIGEKKICGILAETTDTESGTSVILGIGLNLRSSAVSVDLAERATSVESETGGRPTPDAILNPLLRFLFFHYGEMATPRGRAEIRRRWSKLSTYYSGRPVRVEMSDRIIEGVTKGLDGGGGLIVKTPDGSLEIVQAGEVSSLRS
jgi:BirA family biotin operon repressor/biotin-[acetyl-CoA-carboxylase] ligase